MTEVNKFMNGKGIAERTTLGSVCDVIGDVFMAVVVAMLAVAAAALLLFQLQEQEKTSYWWGDWGAFRRITLSISCSSTVVADVVEDKYYWAAGGAILTLSLQALYRWLRNPGSASEYKKTLLRDLETIMQSGLFADVTFVVGGTELKAHRAILAMRGTSLGSTTPSGCSEDGSGYIVVPDMEPDVLRELLVFLYTDRIQPDPQMAPKLLVAADKYDVYTVKEHCERIISRNLSVENAAECALLALRHSCDRLEASSLRFIAAHFDDVMASEGWRTVFDEHPFTAASITRRVAAASLRSRSASPGSRRPIDAAIGGFSCSFTSFAWCGAVRMKEGQFRRH